jgi:hypothetical protein
VKPRVESVRQDRTRLNGAPSSAPHVQGAIDDNSGALVGHGRRQRAQVGRAACAAPGDGLSKCGVKLHRSAATDSNADYSAAAAAQELAPRVH